MRETENVIKLHFARDKKRKTLRRPINQPEVSKKPSSPEVSVTAEGVPRVQLKSWKGRKGHIREAVMPKSGDH